MGKSLRSPVAIVFLEDSDCLFTFSFTELSWNTSSFTGIASITRNAAQLQKIKQERSNLRNKLQQGSVVHPFNPSVQGAESVRALLV